MNGSVCFFLTAAAPAPAVFVTFFSRDVASLHVFFYRSLFLLLRFGVAITVLLLVTLSSYTPDMSEYMAMASVALAIPFGL